MKKTAFWDFFLKVLESCFSLKYTKKTGLEIDKY